MWISSADWFYCPSLRGGRRDTSADGGEAPRRGAESRRMYGQPAAATSAPARDRLVILLRKLANRRLPREGARRRVEVLLHDRVSPVRSDLREIAGLLAGPSQPDREFVTALNPLLTDGRESPLYNPDVQPVRVAGDALGRPLTTRSGAAAPIRSWGSHERAARY